MKRTRISAVFASAVAVSTLHAELATQVIDFGPSYRNPANGIIHLDETFDEAFAQQGVRFSSPSGNPIFWLGADYGFSPAANTIAMGDPRTGENSTHPLRIDFLIPVNFASIYGVDGGGDIDLLRVRAYTNDDVQVDVSFLSDDFGSGGTVSVESERIDYIIVEQTGVNHGLFLDDLTYTQIPSPSTLALLGIGLVIRRKR